jgi:hypothetical protein
MREINWNEPMSRNLHIGIDFDNTLVRYDTVFHKYAIERGLIPIETPKDKYTIRQRIRELSNGEHYWTELQGLVYGVKMQEAKLAEGVDRFLKECRKRRIPVSIISHKTKFPVIGIQVDLREAAMDWMESNGFFSEYGLSRGQVFFESTRAEKINRIITQGCSHFIDDLEEIFLEREFPEEVEKVLYAPGKKGNFPGSIRIFDSWQSITDYFFSRM